MAKTFYNLEEAAGRLNMNEDELKDLVREGRLREFRDGDQFTYKVTDIDKLEAAGVSGSGGAAPIEDLGAVDDIVLEPAEPDLDGESGIELATGGSDVLSLDEVDAEGTAAGGAAPTSKAKEGSVVSSVGVSVFDDDELDEVVDPLAQTQVSDAGALGIEGVGSGSGILDLTRERDDTSLGADLMDDIYAADEETSADAGDDTRSGMEAGDDEGAVEAEPAFAGAPAADAAPGRAAPVATVRQVVEYAPDAASSALTALLAVAVLVMLVGGMGAAALVLGVQPALLAAVYSKLVIYSGAAAGVAVLAAGVTFFLARRSA